MIIIVNMRISKVQSAMHGWWYINERNEISIGYWVYNKTRDKGNKSYK